MESHEENKNSKKSFNDNMFTVSIYILICIGMICFNIRSIFSNTAFYYVVFDKLFPNLIIFGNEFPNSDLLFIFFILCFPVVLTWYIINYTCNHKKSKIKPSIIYFSPLIYIIVMSLLFFGVNKYFSYFSSNKWINYEECRHLMVDDLTSKHELKTLSKDEVINLLGKPNTKMIEAHKIKYFLQHNMMDIDYFYIKFDKNNKAIDYGIVNYDL